MEGNYTIKTFRKAYSEIGRNNGQLKTILFYRPKYDGLIHNLIKFLGRANVSFEEGSLICVKLEYNWVVWT